MKKLFTILFSVLIVSGCDDTNIQMRHDGNDKYVIDGALVDERAPIMITVSENTENLPVVAVLLGSENGKYYVYDDYVDSLQSVGLYPIFISYTHVGQQLTAANPNGILSVGGAFGDLHRTSVTASDKEASWDDMLRAYAYQIVIDYAEHHNLPYLGVCAGEQELAIAMGGKLVGFQTGHNNGVLHDIKIAPNTLLYKIAGTNTATVNSYHSSAVHAPSGGAYRVSATSGKVPEAIEPSKPWSDFVLGVQWHPEKMVSEIDGKIWRAFSDSCRAGGFNK